MRKGLFIVGVILLILGAVLIAVPLIPSTSSFSAASASGSGSAAGSQIAWNIYSASPAIPTYAKLSWTSPVTVYFVAYTCSNDVSSSELNDANSSGQFEKDCGTNQSVGNTSGTSGSYSFTVPAGGSLVFTAFQFTNSSTSTQVSATLTGTEPLLGLVLVVLGIILLILGVVLKSKKQKADRIAGPVAPPPSR
jgi:uncharacterized membrane protein